MAKYKFSNMDQLKNGIDVYLKKMLDNIAEEVFNELRDNVEENVYEWSPSVYKRTMDLYNSIARTKILKNGKGYKVHVYFDASEIMAEYRMPDEWNAHASFSGNEVDGNDLVSWLEYGNHNRKTGEANKYYQHSEHRFYRDTLEWLYYELDMMVEKRLIRYGFKV